MRITRGRVLARLTSTALALAAGAAGAADPAGVQLLGRVGDGVVVEVVTRPSRDNHGAGACGAGEERVVRVRRLRPDAARPWQLAVASCWQGLELDTEAPGRGLEWDGANATLAVRWLVGPGGTRATRRFQVAPDGQVRPIKPPA